MVSLCGFARFDRLKRQAAAFASAAADGRTGSAAARPPPIRKLPIYQVPLHDFCGEKTLRRRLDRGNAPILFSRCGGGATLAGDGRRLRNIPIAAGLEP
jgi:hypothetical protein